MSHTASISRESLMQLGRSGRPWHFLATMRQIGSAADSDPAIVFVHAANLARLGLKELARARLAQLPPQVLALPDVAVLARTIDALPAAALPRAQLIANFDSNARALTARGLPESDVTHWRQSLLAQLDSVPVYKTVDGNIVIPALAEDDVKSQSRDLIAAEKDAGEYPAALLIENLLPPRLLIDAAARWTRNQMGFSRRLILIHEDPTTLALGLSLTDISCELSQSRTWLFLGDGAVSRLSEYLRLHRDEMLVSRLISLRDTQDIQSGLATTVTSRSTEQSAELKDLKEIVDLRYASRDKAFWARRFREATAAHFRAAPLRVLVPTTRYSTVLQHSSRDIVEAFKSIGHDARLLIEPDDSCTLAANAYWRAYADFDPDLVILINFPRPLRTNTTPANIPYVTWLQDAMPHLFDPALAEKLGDMDFACGYLFNECFLNGHWDSRQALASPIPVSTRKFHPAPVPDHDDLVCDVAFVSNHSQTLEQVHERLLANAGAAAASRDCLVALRRLVEQAIADIAHDRIWGALPRRSVELIMSFGVRQDAAEKLFYSYAIPLANETFRHQALAWTAEICLRRGWKFHIYGKGWDTHPALRQFSRGTLAHGEQLRAAYQKAGVQLHLDLNNIMHQRVSECFLSGGCILSRFFADALDHHALRAEQSLIRSGNPPDAITSDGRPAWLTQSHALLRGHEELARSLDVMPRYPDGYWPTPCSPREAFRCAPQSPAADPVEMLGNLSEVTFRDSEDLERRLARALDPGDGFRGRTLERVTPQIRRFLTYDGVCTQILHLISNRLQN